VCLFIRQDNRPYFGSFPYDTTAWRSLGNSIAPLRVNLQYIEHLKRIIMEKHSDFNSQINDINGEVISLTDLLATLWHARWLICVVTSLIIALGLVGALSLAKYKSEGFFQFGGAIPLPKEKNGKDKEASPGIMLADYKRYAAAFGTSERFAEFVQQNKLEATAGVDNLRNVFASRESITKLVEPVYPFTKLDAKELMEQPKDSTNNVIGVRINYEAGTPENAQRMVGLLGRYVMDSIIYMIYSDALRFKHSEMTAKITKLDNDIIDNKEKLEEYRRKGTSLKQIVTRYPESANQAARQVISVTEENARYLSPVTHLMSTEVEASEANEAIYKAKREQQQSILLREYYDRAKALMDGTKSGENILRGLEPVKESVFKSKNLNDELVKEVYNMITIENQNAISLYLEKSRFIAGPSLPDHRSTRLSMVLAVSLLLGLLLSVLLVFGRNWWSENRLKMAD
jgi:LPS O-antigen subunit length determinant protein (WzzB/FepE family)